MRKSGYQMVTRVEASFNFVPTDEFSNLVPFSYRPERGEINDLLKRKCNELQVQHKIRKT